MRNIPIELYKQILDTMPIFCVDMVVYHNGKVLLIERNDEPEKGKWWVPGGRVYKNEKARAAAIRKCKEEIGLDVEIIKEIDAKEYFSKSANFGVKSGTHNICLRYLVKFKNNDSDVKIDNTSAKYKWIDKITPDLEEYVQDIIKKSGVFN